MTAHASYRFENQADNLRIQWWPPQSLASFTCDLQSGHRSFLDQGTLELSNGHQNAELELANWVLLGGIDALARANQRDVSHLQFPNDDSEMSQIAS
jgi:hypothetical protein